MALEFVTSEFKRDFEIVSVAVRQDVGALKFAATELRDSLREHDSPLRLLVDRTLAFRTLSGKRSVLSKKSRTLQEAREEVADYLGWDHRDMKLVLDGRVLAIGDQALIERLCLGSYDGGGDMILVALRQSYCETPNCVCPPNHAGPCLDGLLNEIESEGLQMVDHVEVTIEFRSYFAERLTGQEPEVPSGYIKGVGVFGHQRTGVMVRCNPIWTGHALRDCVLLYHYCPPDSFTRIVANTDLRHLRASYAERAHFGDGVYATQKAPHEFSSKDCILRNNYTNKEDPQEQEVQIAGWRQKGAVDYCVPLLVPRAWAVNVKHERTLEMNLVGCTARHNHPMRSDRDIWVVAIRDHADGTAEHIIEATEVTYQSLRDQDWSIRLASVEILAGKAAIGDDRAAAAVAERLQDPDHQVQVASIWAVACAKSFNKSEAEQKLNSLLSQRPHPSVKSAIQEATQFLNMD